MSLEKEF